jgi:hypothetical protein
MGIKNAKFDADFESSEKIFMKKVRGRELLYTALKGEKVPNYYTFYSFLYDKQTER